MVFVIVVGVDGCRVERREGEDGFIYFSMFVGFFLYVKICLGIGFTKLRRRCFFIFGVFGLVGEVFGFIGYRG